MDIPFPCFWQDVFWAVCAVLPDRRMGRVPVPGTPGRAERTVQREPPGQICCGLRWRQRRILWKHVPGRRGMAGGLCRRAVGAPECQARQPAARDGPCRGAMPWGGQQVLCLRDTRMRPEPFTTAGCRGMQAARVLFRTKIFLAKITGAGGRARQLSFAGPACLPEEGCPGALLAATARRGSAGHGAGHGAASGRSACARAAPHHDFPGHGMPWGTHGRAAG